MEPLRTLQTACGLLVLAALGGLVMAGLRFAGRDHPPTWLAMAHGFLAAAAVTLLLYAWATVGLPAMASTAVILFVIAAAGGVFMNLGYHWRGRPLPKGVMVVHALLAVAGFVLLLMSALHTTQA